MWIDTQDMGPISFTTSDERVKHKVAPLEANADVFMAIKPIRYHFANIGPFVDDGTEHWGFSAREPCGRESQCRTR